MKKMLIKIGRNKAHVIIHLKDTVLEFEPRDAIEIACAIINVTNEMIQEHEAFTTATIKCLARLAGGIDEATKLVFEELKKADANDEPETETA